MVWKLALVTLSLLLVACASQDLPYDSPEVGKNGIAQVLSLERQDYNQDGDNIEVLVWHTVREDGRECDEISYKWNDSGAPDMWFSVRHQRPARGWLVGVFHISLPDAICLHVEAAGSDE